MIDFLWFHYKKVIHSELEIKIQSRDGEKNESPQANYCGSHNCHGLFKEVVGRQNINQINI